MSGRLTALALDPGLPEEKGGVILFEREMADRTALGKWVLVKKESSKCAMEEFWAVMSKLLCSLQALGPGCHRCPGRCF